MREPADDPAIWAPGWMIWSWCRVLIIPTKYGNSSPPAENPKPRLHNCFITQHITRKKFVNACRHTFGLPYSTSHLVPALTTPKFRGGYFYHRAQTRLFCLHIWFQVMMVRLLQAYLWGWWTVIQWYTSVQVPSCTKGLVVVDVHTAKVYKLCADHACLWRACACTKRVSSQFREVESLKVLFKAIHWTAWITWGNRLCM